MAVEVQPVREEDAGLWDRVVQDSPHGTIFHRWKWLRIAEKHSGYRLIPLICRRGDRIVGLYPLFYRRQYFQHLVMSPPPRTMIPFLGPVMPFYQKQKQEDRERELVEFQEAVQTCVAGNPGADYLAIALPFGFPDPRPFSWAGFLITHSYDYEVNLEGTPDELFSRLNRNSRRNVNEARKMQFTVDTALREEIPAVHQLMVDRFRAQGRRFPARLEYFLDLADAFRDELRVLAVRNPEGILSGTIQVRDRDRVWAWVGFPRHGAESRPSPNDLLAWEAISLAHRGGARSYVTVSSAGDPRLHWFYVTKCDPELRIRYNVTKATLLSHLEEQVYFRFIRPLAWRFTS